jgi:phenylacetaldehyde dehydrogenase
LPLPFANRSCAVKVCHPERWSLSPALAAQIVRRRPLGVCGLITPWNHPLLIATKKVSVALATGNTVVVKAPELAPASVVELARCVSEAGAPPGTMNVCTGLGVVAGRALVEHPSVAKIDFTGGTAVGRDIGALAGAHVKHYCAELGGNAPVLVFDDVDMEEAVNGVAFAAFVASGQTCVSAKRILVHAPIFDEFGRRLAAKTDGLRLGPPLDGATQIGPLASAAALAKVEAQVDAGLAAGAVALAGGRRPSAERCALTGGHFFEPTVLGSVSPSMGVFQEEIFGPVVTLCAFRDEAEALALANDNAYALGAAVWTRDLKRAHRVMDGLRAGVIWANAHHRNAPDAPWGGFGASGIGRENGVDAHREYTASSTMIIRTAEEKEDWFAGSAGSRYG